MDRMESENFLRRESYIRYAGVLMTLSPLGNFLCSSMVSGIPHWWRWHALALVAHNVSGMLWFLWTLSFIAGLMMLQGKRASWTFPLASIGINIVFGIVTFKRDVQQGWFLPSLSLGLNMGFFALIYTQEFHQKLERKLASARLKAMEAALSRPFRVPLRRSLKVQFEGIGPWARIIEVTHTGLRLRSLDGKVPRQIESRKVELALAPDLVVQARFLAKSHAAEGDEYTFQFVNLTVPTFMRLHRWAQRESTATQAA